MPGKVEIKGKLYYMGFWPESGAELSSKDGGRVLNVPVTNERSEEVCIELAKDIAALSTDGGTIIICKP